MPWDNSIPTFSPEDVPDEADLNKFINNLNYLHDRDGVYFVQSDGVANYTTTSTTFVDLGSPFSVTDTFKEGVVLALFRARLVTGTNVRFTFNIDGSIIGTSSAGIFNARSTLMQPVLLLRFIPLTAGTHTIKVQWKVDSGTGTLSNNGAYAYMYIREISWTP